MAEATALLSYQERHRRDLPTMPPPPANSAAPRLFAGPALRTQSDRRLVTLVHDGYENAFEEIVRRYGKSLIRYAAAIVSPNRAEDVTQDAFSKALVSLRGVDKEIELRPWLYRIVRNTALNDLRDQPPPSAPLTEQIDGAESPLDAAERREEIDQLVRRLRALPDPQRAAIVMRELEGLSHEEIAAALGMSGGAARQAIYRGRRALRDGAGMLVPLPLLHWLLGGGGAAGAEAAAGAAGIGGAGIAGGAGAGVALKAGAATLLVAGTVGTGVAIDRSSHDGNRASAAQERSGGAADSVSTALSGITTTGHDLGDDHGGHGGGESGDGRGRHSRRGGDGDRQGSGNEGPGTGGDEQSSSSGEGGGSGSSGSSGSSGGGSGFSSGSGFSGSGSNSSSSGSSGSGSESSGSGSETSGDGSGEGSGSGSGSGGDDSPEIPGD